LRNHEIELKGVLIDSGASVNVVDQDTWEMVKKHKCHQSYKSDRSIYSYAASEPLKTIGVFFAVVEVRHSAVEGKFVVIEAQGL